MPAFGDVESHNDALWRKALGAFVAVAPYSTTALTTIFDTDGTLKALPTGWTQLGRPTEDGIAWPRTTDVSELFGMGSTNPGRSDIRRVTKQVTVTIMEANRSVIELAQGIDLSSVTKAVTHPSVTWDEPELPTYGFYRLLAVARDVTVGGEMYIGRELLRCKVTDIGEEAWSDQDAAMVTPLTFSAYFDNAAGTAMRHFRGGPGFASIVDDEGWA